MSNKTGATSVVVTDLPSIKPYVRCFTCSCFSIVSLLYCVLSSIACHFVPFDRWFLLFVFLTKPSDPMGILTGQTDLKMYCVDIGKGMNMGCKIHLCISEFSILKYQCTFMQKI